MKNFQQGLINEQNIIWKGIWIVIIWRIWNHRNSYFKSREDW